jgi:hypothetical protein
MSTITNTIVAVEGAILGLSTAAQNLVRSVTEHNRFCTVESGFEFAGGLTAYSYYAGKFLDVLFTIENIFTINIPFLIHIALLPLKHFLGIAGIIGNTFRAVKESLSLYRQHQFLKIFEKHAWKGSDTRNVLAGTIENFDEPKFQEALPEKFKKIIAGKKPLLERLLKKIDSGDQEAAKLAEKIFAHWTARNIRDKLAEITALSALELERALPVWLNTDIADQGGQAYLSTLLTKVDKGNPKAIDEATRLLNTMQAYAIEKSCVHILKIAGAIIGALACVGFFIAAPLPFTFLFLFFIGVFSAGAYMYNSGVVENRNGGFSLKLCVPEFIRNLAFDISHSPVKIRAWINAKKPRIITPHPFFEKRIKIARHTVHAVKKSAVRVEKNSRFAAELLQRRTRRVTRGILLCASKVA